MNSYNKINKYRRKGLLSLSLHSASVELSQVSVDCDSGAVFAIAALYRTNFILFEYFFRFGAVGPFTPL